MLLPDRYLAQPDHRIAFSLFMATVMAISAMPVAARALYDLNLSKTDLGFLIMSAMSVNDIIGWLLFTLVLGFSTQGNPDVARILAIFVGTIGFAVFCLTVGRRLANAAVLEIRRREMPQPGAALTFIVLLGVLCGAITQWIGIHALFGFFLAGIMAGEAQGTLRTDAANRLADGLCGIRAALLYQYRAENRLRGPFQLAVGGLRGRDRDRQPLPRCLAGRHGSRNCPAATGRRSRSPIRRAARWRSSSACWPWSTG